MSLAFFPESHFWGWLHRAAYVYLYYGCDMNGLALVIRCVHYFREEKVPKAAMMMFLVALKGVPLLALKCWRGCW